MQVEALVLLVNIAVVLRDELYSRHQAGLEKLA
jgi:hypothetical protein